MISKFAARFVQIPTVRHCQYALMSSVRIEKDTFGPIEVPENVYYGAQTARSIKNFPICADTDKMPTGVIHALGDIKLSAAQANHRLELLDAKLADGIVKAAREVSSGGLDAGGHFPLVVWQTGSGTQSNMNVNEVISNRANQLLGHALGEKFPVHPNDHVNMGQSSNDVFPTAMNIAAVLATLKQLLPALNTLIGQLEQKRAQLGHLLKVGRTHMQDAVPMTLGQELGGFISQLEFCRANLHRSVPIVASSLAIGGTAVGTGLNSRLGFDQLLCDCLNENRQSELSAFSREMPELRFAPAQNKFAALASHDTLLTLSADLNTTATVLLKLANDVRLLGSGPRCGLGELLLPENEPGSSIMPGKVNPTQCEALSMACVQAMANHNAVSLANSQGHLQLNVYKPMIAANVLHSVRLLGDSAASFAERCVRDLEANETRLQENISRSLMLVTALNPHVGYDNAAKIAKLAHKNNGTLKEAAIELGLLSAEDFDKFVDPNQMLGPTPPKK